MKYTCDIDDALLRCSITSHTDLTKPVFCFAGMAPMYATEGGVLVRNVGGYSEIELPNLIAGQTHQFALSFVDDFKPANRAWMPLGPYLRVGEDCIVLPPTKSGVLAEHAYTADSSATEEYDSANTHNGTLRVIPQVQQWKPSGEQTTISGITFDSSVKINDPLQQVAQLANRRNLFNLIDNNGTPVRIEQIELPVDAYQLRITNQDIVISTGSAGGALYAGITLLTLLENHSGTIPCGIIEDAPRFAWRGQHLDTARHFYELETIFELLDVMALLKLNRFHWHFADDEAFRLQLDSCTELWRQTQMRGETHLIPALFSGAIEAGGSYSKDDARQVIKYAKALNIEVLPEIETPAHAFAITAVYPFTRDPEDSGAETSVQGYVHNIVNPAMPKTWELLDAMAIEVSELFPFGHIHIGGDELPENTWMESPKAKALMVKEGLQNTDDLSGWTLSRLATTLANNGQRPVAWEEAARGSTGGIGHNAILFSWTGQGPGLDGARAGYDVVMCPAQHTYLDMAHTSDVNDWGANWAAYISLADTIAWDVVPDAELNDKIIGVQGAFWSEFTTSDSQIWPMLLPRITGIASKAWQTDDITVENLQNLAGYYLQDKLNLVKSE